MLKVSLLLSHYSTSSKNKGLLCSGGPGGCHGSGLKLLARKVDVLDKAKELGLVSSSRLSYLRIRVANWTICLVFFLKKKTDSFRSDKMRMFHVTRTKRTRSNLNKLYSRMKKSDRKIVTTRESLASSSTVTTGLSFPRVRSIGRGNNSERCTRIKCQAGLPIWHL